MKTNKTTRGLLTLLAITLASAALHAQKAKVVAPAEKAAPITATVAAQPAGGKEEAKTDVKPQATAEFKLLGFLGFAYAEGTYVLTCGGPKVGFTYGAFGMAAGFYPSLVYSDAYRLYAAGGAATPVRPNLGAGIEISYGKVAIILPMYYLTPNSYYYTIGIGYKF